jgi:cytosine/adenosine deaminase-related metal-dependent hydrolase
MLYLSDATFVDWETLKMVRGTLEVEEGPRGTARFVSRITRPGRTLDCSGKFVTKSFAVAHHHLYSALARGMPPPKRAPKSFVDILRLVWWNLDKKLDRAMIRACALAGGIEAAKAGTTFIIDHHSSPNAIPGSLEIIAQALEEVGLSHLLCYELSDRDGASRRDEGLKETARYLSGRAGFVGLHASFTVSDRLLKRAVELAGAFGAGLHVHAAEALCDEQECLKAHQGRVLQRFAKAGVLANERTLLAHGIHLDEKERRLFRNSPAWLVENPQSNQNNAVGSLCPDGLGKRILLGTDGMHGDMLQSARSSFLAGQSHGGGSPAASYRRLRRVHDYLEQNHFAGDGGNNLVVLDYAPPTPATTANWAAHLLYGMGRENVESVISQGRLIVHKRRAARVDEEAVRRFTHKQAERLWRRL